MKLRIHNQQTGLTDTVEVIDEFEDLMTLRNKLNKLYSTNEDLRNKKLFLIFKNMVLSDDKILKFYKISDNDEISVRYLENLLQNDEHILEIFLAGLFPSIMYLIVEQDDRISTVKSIIRNIVQNISRIYDKNSNEISLENNVIDIDRNNGYYKLIISCDNTSVGGENQTIKTCCDLHDRYFIDLYLKKFPSIIRKIDYEDDWKTNLINKINTMREKINNVNVDKFNGILSIFDNQLVRSRFLFVTEMAEHINHYCDEFWNETFDVSSYPVRDHFFAVLHICLNEDIVRNENIGRNIVIQALNTFENYLGVSRIDWRSLMKSHLDSFLIGSYSTDGIEARFGSIEPNPSINIRQNQRILSICIPIENNNHQISELKLAVSFQTNVQMNYLYFIRLNSERQPENTDVIENEDLDKYLIEIISSNKNIKKLEKQTNNFQLYENTSTKKTFGLKKPRRDEDLYPEISNYCRINNCRYIKEYIGLFFVGNRVCLALEYMPNGSLISYVEKHAPLHEAKISKFSHQILTTLAALHEDDWIHRDIKGDNFVLDDDLKAILIDFEVAIKCKSFQDFFKRSLGTLGYIAPELLDFNNTECDNKVDIWSFGVMVIEMINGKRIKQIHGINVPHHKELRIKTSIPICEDLTKFYQACLTVKPDERSSAKKLIKSKFIRVHNKYILE